MKGKVYFHFADPHSFRYPLYVKFWFWKKENCYIFRKDRTRWREVCDYSYYWEPVKCILPEQPFEYEFLVKLFVEAQNSDNVFGAVNYMLKEYNTRFLEDVENHKLICENYNILTRYFKNEIR